MKKNYFILFLVFISSLLSAQSKIENKYLLQTKTNTFGLSTVNLTDPYLSPLNYSGLGIRSEFEMHRLLKLDNNNISTQSKLSLMGAIALNPTNSASMMCFGANYGWGLHYHFRPLEQLQLLAGGLIDIDFGFKNIPRNVNNPVNVDLATNLNISGLAIYGIQTRRRLLKLQLSAQSPIFGYMFVPKVGSSYFEMFSLWNLTGATHLTSIHNKRGINGTFSIYVPFNYSTWRFGFRYENLKYSANDLVFKRNEINILIGTTFDVAKFAGRKNTPPKNFINFNN
ncbi:MAG: DUF3316 domain-containing protein [Paludibacter sp.]